MMMRFIFLLSCLVSLFMPNVDYAAGFLKTDKFFISKLEAKEQELVNVKGEFEALNKDAAIQDQKIDALLQEIKDDIAKTKADLENEPENEFYSQKLVDLNDRYQALKDYRQALERLVNVYRDLIQLLEDYFKDPDLSKYRQELAISERIEFSFEELRQIKEKIDAKKASVELLHQKEANTQTEIKSREQAAAALVQQYNEKRDEQEKSNQKIEESFDLSVQQKRELINLEYALLGTKKEVDEFQLQILNIRMKLLHAKMDIERQQLKILQEVFARIKQSSIRISEADVAFARDELEKKRQELNAAKIDKYEPQKEEIKRQIAEKRDILSSLSKQYNIPLTEELDEWLIFPKQSIASYFAFLNVARANELFALEQRKLEDLDAQIDLKDQTWLHERIETDIKSSFYKIYAKKFASEEKIFEEIKKYEVKLSDITADLSQLENRKSLVEAQLSIAKKALDNIGQKRQEILEQKDGVFKNNLKEYTQALEILNEAETVVRQQVKKLNTIRGIYNDTVLKLLKTEQQVRFTIEELRASSRSIIWDRPEDAISWQGVKNIFSDIETFVNDVWIYITHFDATSLVYKIKGLFNEQFSFAYFIGYAILWFIFIIIIWIMLPGLRETFYRLGKGRSFPRQFLFLGDLLNFMAGYFLLIALWASLFLLLNYYVIPDPYPYIIFYLISIPLLLYLANRYVHYFIARNAEHNYLFIGKEYIARFVSCLSTLLYATIVIFFFREAFILTNYPKSELPNILKALNIIILQISAIFMLTKELVLSFIPRTNDMWILIRDKVDHYYYFILVVLITIIVMMNPYVGFGRLVLFILSRVVYTLLLIGALFWLHGLVKGWSSSFFFYSEQEVVKERFPSAKTWYGVSIIGILMTFVFVGAIVVAKIWQWPDQLTKINEFADIKEWLKTPLFSDTNNPLSVFSVLQIMFFVIAGFLAAIAIKRFVLSRIFDVLLVDSGVQNTVNSLMRYLVMLIAILLGLNEADLGVQINVILGALLFGLGFIIKDPAADFFAYFILLVQRPIKIGDFIKIDDEATGVVRKITPRSVVLRRKNSTMVIVPNSYVTNHTIINWNYIRGFIAFNDIHVQIAYSEDPVQAKELFERLLDASPYVLKNPKPIVRLDNFGANGFEFMLRGYVSSNYTLDQWNISSDIRLQIVKLFKDRNIKLALPIRVMVNYQGQQYEHGVMPETSSEQMEE